MKTYEPVDLGDCIVMSETEGGGWCKVEDVPAWQPIATVPKDGTHVIILCPGGRVATASYEKQSFIGEGWFVLVPCNGGFGMGSDTFLRWDDDQPTHWMPIPAGPEE